jgi:hypothetical protein
MDHSPRAERRFRQAAMKAKARRIYPHDPKARAANHLKVCSCWMCGNQRNIRGKGSFSEERAKAVAHDAIRKALEGTDDA